MRALAAILLTLILSQTAIKGGVFVWFKSNQLRLAATECVNRDVPMMNCNGKCVLAKKLQAAERRKQNPAIPVSVMQQELQPMIVCPDEKSEDRSDLIKQPAYHERFADYAFLHTSDIFHPPQWTC